MTTGFGVGRGTSERTLLTLRGPLALLVGAALLWVSIATLDDKADRVNEQAELGRQLRVKETPVMTAMLGWTNRKLHRQTGRFAPNADALVNAAASGLPERSGERWREFLLFHRIDARGDARSFEIVMYAYHDGGPSFRLFVDLPAQRLEQTCKATPEQGCHRGRWSTEEAAHIPAERWLAPMP